MWKTLDKVTRTALYAAFAVVLALPAVAVSQSTTKQVFTDWVQTLTYKTIWTGVADGADTIKMDGANLVFEGATADAFEATLSALDVGADEIWRLGVLSLEVEGTADGSEGTLAFEEPTADITYQFRDDAADTYNVMASPDGNLTESQIWLPVATGMPSTAAEAEDALASDNIVVCYRYFNPQPVTVTEAVVYGLEVASGAGTDLIGLAIYEDADAGTNLAEGTTAYATDGQANVIDISDVTLDTDWYRVCLTQSDVTAFDWMAVALGTAETAINDDTVASEATFAAAANSATDGDMPDTTGALSATAEAKPIVRLQSN